MEIWTYLLGMKVFFKCEGTFVIIIMQSVGNIITYRLMTALNNPVYGVSVMRMLKRF